MKKIDIKTREPLRDILEHYYDALAYNALLGAPYGYKRVQVNKYLFHLPIPSFSIDKEEQAIYWRIDWVGILKTGTERIRIPRTIFDRLRGKKRTIKFARYSRLDRLNKEK